jgi:hypothetical protein
VFQTIFNARPVYVSDELPSTVHTTVKCRMSVPPLSLGGDHVKENVLSSLDAHVSATMGLSATRASMTSPESSGTTEEALLQFSWSLEACTTTQ